MPTFLNHRMSPRYFFEKMIYNWAQSRFRSSGYLFHQSEAGREWIGSFRQSRDRNRGASMDTDDLCGTREMWWAVRVGQVTSSDDSDCCHRWVNVWDLCHTGRLGRHWAKRPMPGTAYPIYKCHCQLSLWQCGMLLKLVKKTPIYSTFRIFKVKFILQNSINTQSPCIIVTCFPCNSNTQWNSLWYIAFHFHLKHWGSS